MEDTELAPDYLLQEQYKTLGHEGLGWTEIRVPKLGISIFVDSQEDYVKEALKFCKEDCYVGINPRKANKGSGANGTGMAEDIAFVTAIVFDFDPVRPRGQASTDAQHDESIALASEFNSDFAHGLLVSSGSGAHVYMPIRPIPVTGAGRHSNCLASFAHEVQARYSTPTVKVDSTFDLPRIIRCWGSHNTKSNRPCYYLSGESDRQNFNIEAYYRPEATAMASGQVSTKPNATTARFQRLCETNPALRKQVEGTATYPSRSECDFAFGATLYRAGFTVSEVASLLPKNKKGKSHERNDREIAKEAERIYEKVLPTLKTAPQSMQGDSYLDDLSKRSPGIPTGFKRWDDMTAGLKGNRFYVTAGRPTEGKTTYLVQGAVNVAKAGHRVMMFPTECRREQVFDKIMSTMTHINLRKFQFGNFSLDERAKIADAVKVVEKLPIMIVENFSLRLHDIVSAVDNYGPDYLIVDFLNSMYYKDPNSSSELAANVMGIKNIGQKKNIPVNLACQLHRKDKSIEDSLSDLKGTGALEEQGDITTFIRTINPDPYPCKSKASILKNKYGEPGIIPMDFYRSTCEFKEEPLAEQ